MDVDKSPQRALSSANKDGGSFFPPQPQLQLNEQSIEGSWVYRDDQDLVEKTVEDTVLVAVAVKVIASDPHP